MYLSGLTTLFDPPTPAAAAAAAVMHTHTQAGDTQSVADDVHAILGQDYDLHHVYLFPHTVMKYSPAYVQCIAAVIDEDPWARGVWVPCRAVPLSCAFHYCYYRFDLLAD